jgi:hypothetical protein
MTDNPIHMSPDGLPYAASNAAWDRMSDEEKATILSQWTKTWSAGGSCASPTSARSAPAAPAPPKPFDTDDRTIRDNWLPSPSELAGTKFNDWK